MLTTPGAIGATDVHLDQSTSLSNWSSTGNGISRTYMGSVSFRIADGDSDNSDQEDNFSIGDYEAGESGDTAVEELKAAASGP